MKGRSSRYLRQEFPWLKSRLPTLWTNSYFVTTVGGAPISVIKRYIENQKMSSYGCQLHLINADVDVVAVLEFLCGESVDLLQNSFCGYDREF